MAQRLNDRTLKALAPREKGLARLPDHEVVGFGAVKKPNGVALFYFDFADPSEGKRRRSHFGRFPAWTVQQAREHAASLRRALDSGESIIEEESGEQTVADLAAKWLETVKLTRRASTADRYGRHVERFIVPSFGAKLPRDIRRNDVENWHAKIALETPTQANRALASLSVFLSWCRRDDLIEANPASGVRRKQEDHREVFLSSVEISVAEAMLERHAKRSAALSLLVAMWTGARIGEVVAIREHIVDLQRLAWVKRSSQTKQNKPHTTLIPSRAVPVLKELLKLEAPTDKELRAVLEDLRKILNRPDVRVHDLRHTRASQLARGGASLPQIGKVLGHSAPATTARYLHLVDDDLRDLVERTTQESPEPRPLRQRA